MTLKQLAIKLATLLAICTGQRLQTLQSLTVHDIHFHRDTCPCTMQSLRKTTRSGKRIKPIAFKKDPLCGLCANNG